MRVGEPEDDETQKERVNRELNELLEEIRVAIPGAEVLFAFLLGVAFTARFVELSNLQRNVYFFTLVTAAGATSLLIAPAAHHRLAFRGGDKEKLLFTATRLAVASLVMVLVAISGVVFLVGDLLYSTAFATTAAAVTGCWFGWFWFLLPWRTSQRRQADS